MGLTWTLRIEVSVPIWTAVEGRPLHHLGYWVDDLAEVSAQLEEQGCPKVACAMSNGRMFGMAYHEMPDGMYVELVARTSFPGRPSLPAPSTTSSIFPSDEPKRGAVTPPFSIQ